MIPERHCKTLLPEQYRLKISKVGVSLIMLTTPSEEMGLCMCWIRAVYFKAGEQRWMLVKS